jgi:hypothetical protein
MFKDLRKFVRMVDAVLSADKTRKKTDAVYACVNKRIDAEKQAEAQAVEKSKENSAFNKDLIISLIPQIAQLFKTFLDDTSPKKPQVAFGPPYVHVDRPTIATDREDLDDIPGRQCCPPAVQTDAPAPPAGKDLPVEQMKMIEAAFSHVRKAMTDMNNRLTVMEAGMSNVSAPLEAISILADRLNKLEAFTGIKSDVPQPPVSRPAS